MKTKSTNRRSSIVFWAVAAIAAACTLGLTHGSALATAVICQWPAVGGCVYSAPVECPWEELAMPAYPNSATKNVTTKPACTCTNPYTTGQGRGRIINQTFAGGPIGQYQQFRPLAGVTSGIRGAAKCYNPQLFREYLISDGTFFTDYNAHTKTCPSGHPHRATRVQMKTACFWRLADHDPSGGF